MVQDIVKLNHGRIVLMLADCLDALPKIKVPIQLLIADQPYFRATSEEWDHQWTSEADHLEWSKTWIDLAITKLSPTASFYFWYLCGSKHQLFFKLGSYLSEVMYFQELITWQKSRGRGNRIGWLQTREDLIWCTKSQDYIWNEQYQYDPTQPTNRKDLGFNGQPRKSQFKRYTNIWPNNDDQDYGKDRVRFHYTPKPVPLIERIVLAHTLSNNDVVCDPFLGSGTTGVVCAKHNRPFIGIEKDPNSFYPAVERIREAL